MLGRLWGTLSLLLLLLAAGVAHAEILHAPVGGRAIALGEGRVACQSGVGGWAVELRSRHVRPPSDESAIGQAVDLKVAASHTACTESEQHVTLVTTARHPTIELGSVVFSPDEGRLDAQGARLLGVGIAWSSGEQSGFDTCRDVFTEQGVDHCSWGVGRGTSADPRTTQFSWLPRGARTDPDSTFFDASGRRISPEELRLEPTRVLVTRLVPADAAVDLGTGQGEVPLLHPEAVASAECGQLSCEMSEGKLVVRGASNIVSSMEVRLKLVPHVYYLRKGQSETQVTLKLPILHCPMTIVSGPPVRHNEEAKVVVKLSGRCAKELTDVRFVTRDGPLKILRTVTERDDTYVLLSLGHVQGDTLTISAERGDTEGIALAVAYAPLRSAPAVRAALELPGHPNLSFIPNNRWATVHASPAGEYQYFSVLPIDGVYMVQERHAAPSLIRADTHASGLAVLRFGLRYSRLPAGLDRVDLAVVTDPLQRGTGEANLPAPLVSEKPETALIEVLCGGGSLPLERIEVGVTSYLSFDLRDTCRVILHRERLSQEYGTQKLNYEVEVLKPDGFPRAEARVVEQLTVRPGTQPRFLWIKGITDPFDRLRVRVNHVADENHYIGAEELNRNAPEAQWSAVMGTGRLRLYGTSTIPTGLYLFPLGNGKDDSADNGGVLALNFGVISRLAWLDKEGKEFPVGFESGVLVFGLVNSQSQNGRQLRQVGVVMGLGFAVPISNRGQISQASVNLHAWVEVNAMKDVDRSRFAFIFGPSISIGNVGTGL